jgi:precorrin-6B methylase 1
MGSPSSFSVLSAQLVMDWDTTSVAATLAARPSIWRREIDSDMNTFVRTPFSWETNR